jgi:3-oxoacyl-[acyl-carrier-protein] synthase-1
VTHRVAVTGVGIVSCLGIGADAVSRALQEGLSGVVSDPERVELGFRSPLTGCITSFDAQAYLTRKQRKTMPDFAIQAYAAAEEAMVMAGLPPDGLRGPDHGVVFGADSSSLAAIRASRVVLETGETRAIGSSTVFGVMTSCVSMNLACILGVQGACWTVSAACASGAMAIGQAAELIASGKQDRVLCGGAQEMNWESAASFDAIGAFSLASADPAKASKPFDASRDGLVPSGGAAALILERYDLAIRRGAVILGEVLGYGNACDGDNLVIPSGLGLSRAIGRAMRLAGILPDEIDYVCAHATSTPRGDEVEAKVIMEVFGEWQPPVSSLKSMTGHELWMAGASQAVSCVLMARDGFLAPNINFIQPDEHSARLNIIRETVPYGPCRALINAAGFGGTNAALVLGFGR